MLFILGDYARVPQGAGPPVIVGSVRRSLPLKIGGRDVAAQQTLGTLHAHLVIYVNVLGRNVD